MTRARIRRAPSRSVDRREMKFHVADLLLAFYTCIVLHKMAKSARSSPAVIQLSQAQMRA
jgi:hypothetical protein